MMADAKHLLEFLEGGIGMLFDLSLEFLRVEFAPMTPTGFGGQRSRLHGVQIPVNGAPTQFKAPGGFGFGAARFDEVHHPFPQVQRICFHALKPITLCPNVNMKCYSHPLTLKSSKRVSLRARFCFWQNSTVCVVWRRKESPLVCSGVEKRI